MLGLIRSASDSINVLISRYIIEWGQELDTKRTTTIKRGQNENFNIRISRLELHELSRAVPSLTRKWRRCWITAGSVKMDVRAQGRGS